MANNPNKYWFKRRRYGYGWTPVTWKGWLIIGVFLTVVLGGSWYLTQQKPEPTDTDIFWFYTALFIAVVMLFIFTRLKGPYPKWRWGKKPTDNPDEDI